MRQLRKHSGNVTLAAMKAGMHRETATKYLRAGMSPSDHHLLTHLVLPYSNWQWALPCASESSLSLRRGVQAGFWRLGGVAPVLQTDCSSTATHQIERGSHKRTFNEDYLEFCRYLKTQAHTIHVDSPDENGDVEAAHRHLKRRIRNHLILRGSHDFASEADSEAREDLPGECQAP